MINFIIITFQASLLIGSASPNVETTFSSWQSHLDVNWGAEKMNVTECLTSCLCGGEEADCSSKDLTTFPSFTDKTSVIKTLDLSGNRIKVIPPNAFKMFPHLDTLILKNNLLNEISEEFSKLQNIKNLQLGGNNISVINNRSSLPSSLKTLSLEKNKISEIQPGTFSLNTNLSILNLAYNRFTGSGFFEKSLAGLDGLQILELNNNLLTKVPEALTSLKSLEKLSLAKNLIETIPSGIFSNLRLLRQVELRGNPIHHFHPNSFVNLPSLKKLQVLGSPRVTNSFPNLTGTPGLELIHLDRVSLEEVPPNLCSLAPSLHTLRLRSNNLKHLPQLHNCSQLVQLDLGLNLITEIDGSPFQNLKKLQDLLLDRNQLKYLSADIFTGLQNLQILDLEKNNITEIHKDAFLPLNNVKDLNVGQNHFNELPDQGLKTIIELKAHNNPELKEFPKAENFPHIRLVRPSYAYHCCLFMPSTYENIVPEYADFGDLSEDVLFPGEFDLSEFGNKSMPSVIWSNSGNFSNQIGPDLSQDLWENFVSGISGGYPDVADYDPTSISFFQATRGHRLLPSPRTLSPLQRPV